jgi:hypothetical protein
MDWLGFAGSVIGAVMAHYRLPAIFVDRLPL